MDQKSNYEVFTNSRSCLSDKLCTFCSEESKEKRGYLKIRMQERSPSEGPTAEALQGSDSPNCKEDRRLQNKYEKFVLQTEALQIRIVELEAELKRCKYETPPDQENEEVCFPKDSLLIKMEDSRACLEGTQDREVEQTQRTNTKHSKLFFEMEELKSKLKRTKKGKKEKS